MKNTDNLLPFDLKVALKYPDRVITRCGTKVLQFTHYPRSISSAQIAVMTEELDPYFVDENGMFYSNTDESRFDLFLLPPEPHRKLPDNVCLPYGYRLLTKDETLPVGALFWDCTRGNWVLARPSKLNSPCATPVSDIIYIVPNLTHKAWVAEKQ